MADPGLEQAPGPNFFFVAREKLKIHQATATSKEYLKYGSITLKFYNLNSMLKDTTKYIKNDKNSRDKKKSTKSMACFISVFHNLINCERRANTLEKSKAKFHKRRHKHQVKQLTLYKVENLLLRRGKVPLRNL